MKLSVQSDNGDVLRLEATGRIAMVIAGEQIDVISDLLGDRGYARSVILDLAQTDYIDSGGVSWLVISNKRFIEAGGKLVIHSAHVAVLDIFKMMRLDRVLNLARDEAAALALLPGED